MKPNILCIVGPTAVGKTDVSLELAQKLKGEIVCVDSTLVYKEFDIGTAKPTLVQRAVVPHHCLDLVTADQEFTAYDFCVAAHRVIDDVVRRGKRAILVGGSGFYFRALERGMLGAPPKDVNMRKEIEEDIKNKGLARVYEDLKLHDPESAEKIHSHDQYRIIRALEVFRLSGKPLSRFYKEHISQNKYEFKKVGIKLDDPEHMERIKKRTEQMLESGFLDEVQNLMKKYPPMSKAFQSVGYKQAILYLQNQLSYGKLIDMMNLETRHLAKQQLTWFKKDKEIKWLLNNSLYFDNIVRYE